MPPSEQLAAEPRPVGARGPDGTPEPAPVHPAGAGPAYRFGKRAFDLTGALCGLAVLSPLMLAIAAAVKLDSWGPMLYLGTRTGQGGKPFRMFKFRTMVSNAERIGGPSTGLGDPRVTRVGRFLRRYKLDELPQLINVVRGEMSLVGPRPEVPQYTAEYRGDELLILTVKPGITDFASLEFIRLDEALGSHEPDRVYEEKVRPVKNALRVRYAREQSFRTDLSILFRTLRRLLP
jgi:lipopolysaccharide/colanic/teichoic acid biosynthesis glycosyltransferase